MTKEKMLLQGLQAGKSQALEAIIRAYTPYVSGIIAGQMGRFSAAADVEELVSDTFLALWQWRERLETDNLRGWLAVTARNKARSFLRKRRPDPVDVEDWFILPDEQSARLLEGRELQDILDTALNSLDPESREVLLQHYYHCRTTTEIATALSMSQSAVKSRLARGRKKLKDILIQGGFDLETLDF